LDSEPPPQRKFLCILTNSFITQVRALKKEKKYKCKLERTELMRVTHPPIERFMSSTYLDAFSLISQWDFHITFLLRLTSTEISKKRKGIESTS
jgi:hypothetical protein